jgi:hypothetical protein
MASLTFTLKVQKTRVRSVELTLIITKMVARILAAILYKRKNMKQEFSGNPKSSKKLPAKDACVCQLDERVGSILNLKMVII